MKRFISCFCEDAEVEDKKITFITEDKLKFMAKGLEILNKGWMEVYPVVMKESEIETIEGEKEIENVKIEEKMTKPPKRYTPASIISELEKRNLGTKATRAGIIETLYKRNYIKEQSIKATPLGIKLISTLEKYSPIIIDEALTRHFEEEMEKIQKTKKNLTNLQDKIIEEAKETIKKIAEDFKKNETAIGKELVEANEDNYKEERKEKILNSCPVCKKGTLRILFNKKLKKSFVACSNYPECKTTFSLPSGMIKASGKICEFCGFPKLVRIKKGKRPWEFCFNPECESRKKEQEENSR